jgi:hypothetical protein
LIVQRALNERVEGSFLKTKAERFKEKADALAVRLTKIQLLKVNHDKEVKNLNYEQHFTPKL